MNKKTLWYVLIAILAVGIIISFKADKSGMNGGATMYDAIYPPTEPIYPPADYIYPPTDYIYPPTDPIYPPTDYIYPPY